jgi:curved DNA-binding protein CbpA
VADFYEVLGVSKAATAAEVRQAYLRIARERHPDRFQDPEEKQKAQDFFKRATEAFNTLGNERNREQYDAEAARPRLTGPAEIAADAHRRALGKLEERDFHEATTLLRTAVHHAPDVADYHADLARALAQNPHWIREAIEQIEAAIRLQGRNVRYYVDLARLLTGQGLKLRAQRAAETAQRLAPQDPAVRELLAALGAGAPEAGADPGRGPGGLLERLRRKS